MCVKIHPTIHAWLTSEYELGILTFRATDKLTKEWFYVLPQRLTPIAIAEADLLCLDTETGELLVLDHEVKDRVLCKAAKSQETFLEATDMLFAYFRRCGKDDEFSNNEAEGAAARQACTVLAGGSEYERFFCSLVGW